MEEQCEQLGSQRPKQGLEAETRAVGRKAQVGDDTISQFPAQDHEGEPGRDFPPETPVAFWDLPHRTTSHSGTPVASLGRV